MTVLQNEVEAMGDMFTRMNRQCYEKCLSKPIFEGKGDYLFPMFDGKGVSTGDPELTLDDNNCVSNCAAKFSHAQSLVGNYYMEQVPCLHALAQAHVQILTLSLCRDCQSCRRRKRRRLALLHRDNRGTSASHAKVTWPV